MKKILMQSTVEYMNKTNPKKLKELEKGPKFEVRGTEKTGFYYTWDIPKEPKGKFRILLDGSKAPELDELVELDVITRCPEKYILQDIETGEIYKGTNNRKKGNHWKRLLTIKDKD